MAMSEESRKEFKEMRMCLNRKISWRVVGAVIGIFSIVAMLSFAAYSGGQGKQDQGIRDNSKNIDAITTCIKVTENNVSHIREQLKEVKEDQRKSFEAILEELKQIRENGGN